MWVKDSKKVTAQGYIRADIGSNITNVKSMADKIRGVMTGVINTLGEDEAAEILTDCRIALGKLETAERILTECSAATSELNTDKWIEDEQY
jgi:hypothetical protein